jgi:MaoC like domain
VQPVDNEILAEKCFALDDQHRFALLSGDSNPLHLDALAARRSLAGQPLVHGIHLLLWSLDALCRRRGPLATVAALRVRFEHMVPVGVLAQAVLIDHRDDRSRLDLRIAGQTAVMIIVSFGSATAPAEDLGRAPLFDPVEPLELSMDEIAGMAGKVAPRLQSVAARSLFPALAESMESVQIAGLAAASFLVGMVCPGLFSLFRGLEFTSVEPDKGGPALHYKVMAVDARFQLVQLAVSGLGWRGKIDAHRRPAPVTQPDMSEIAAHVGKAEFQGAKALIIGGSRGLGEVLAKILAAGSAEVALTYRVGEAEARRVQAQIEAFGGRCSILRYDADEHASTSLSALRMTPDQLYYMATPAIRRSSATAFDLRLFQHYSDCYLRSFTQTISRASRLAGDSLSVFYPSTAYIDTPTAGFLEYAAAKAAGEALCKGLETSGTVRIALVRRLPRLSTDQTHSVRSETFPDSLPLLLTVAREMNPNISAISNSG